MTSSLVMLWGCLLLSSLSTSAAWRLLAGAQWRRSVGAAVVGCSLLGWGDVEAARAEQQRTIASIETSGIIPGFKDTLKVTSFADPKLPSVHLYLADFERSLAEKISSNPFNDPSSSSLSCVVASPPTAAQIASLSGGERGEEVLSESKNLIFKSIKVRRVYDASTNTAIYASFSSRFDNGDDANKSRFKSSLCAVSLNGPAAAAVAPR